jgi:hypothetical protein
MRTDGEMATLRCEGCAKQFLRRAAEVRYRRRCGIVRTFCSMSCAGAVRRTAKADKVARKKLYDEQYRAKHRARLKKERAAWYQANRDPEKERAHRAANMKRHVEYCRKYYADPARRAEKIAYDRDRRAAAFGEFGEAWKVYVELAAANRRRGTTYERLRARGYYERKREQCELRSESKKPSLRTSTRSR